MDLRGPHLQTMPSNWTSTAKMWATRVGDHSSPEGRSFLHQRSPLNFVDQIESPLMIVRGGQDQHLSEEEPDEIIRAMRQNNVPVTYLVYPDEGHGLARPANQLAFFAVAEAFLAEHLGGRYEPIGDDLDHSSIRIPVGGSELPGEKQTGLLYFRRTGWRIWSPGCFYGLT